MKRAQLRTYLAVIGYMLAAVSLLCIPIEAEAQTAFDDEAIWPGNPVACTQRIRQLDPYYRGHLIAECFLFPAGLCSQREDPELCIQAANNMTREFIIAARSELPPHLPMTGIWSGFYYRTLDRIELPTEPVFPECVNHPDTTEKICSFIELMMPARDAFIAAGLANMEFSDYPRRKLPERLGLEPGERDPVDCLAVAVTINSGFRFVFEGQCVDLGWKACLREDGDDGRVVQCLEAHIASMRKFLTLARDAMPANINSENLPSADYRRELGWVDDRIDSIAICESQIQATTCEYVGYAYAILRLLEIAEAITPDFTDNLIER